MVPSNMRPADLIFLRHERLYPYLTLGSSQRRREGRGGKREDSEMSPLFVQDACGNKRNGVPSLWIGHRPWSVITASGTILGSGEEWEKDDSLLTLLYTPYILYSLIFTCTYFSLQYYLIFTLRLDCPLPQGLEYSELNRDTRTDRSHLSFSRLFPFIHGSETSI